MIAVWLGIKPTDRVGVYAGINEIYDESGTHVSATRTKQYLVSLTFERAIDVDLPFELNAIYNGARGDVVC